MSPQLAAAEPYTTRWESTVRSVDGTAVTLETTFFYAESGGQPADRGRIAGIDVVDVQHEADGVVHYLAEAPAFGAGHQALCDVDWEYRMYCMRAHTASHALYGAARRRLDDLGYGGFDIGDEKVRIDFESSTPVDDEELVELESLVNRAVWQSRDVEWEEVPVAEAERREDVAFNAKTEEGVFGDADTVRLVTIGDADGDRSTWDVAACGGTHVRNTREIGPITLLSRSNPGEGLTRIEFAVGGAGIERRATEKRAVLEASDALGTSVADLPDAVERLRNEREELEATVAAYGDRLVDARIADLADDPVERDGRAWIVGTVADADANALAAPVREATGDRGDVVVLTGEDGGTFVVAGATDGVDAGDVVDRITGEFGGGGGGSPAFAQGGGIDAAPETVVDFVRNEW